MWNKVYFTTGSTISNCLGLAAPLSQGIKRVTFGPSRTWMNCSPRSPRFSDHKSRLKDNYINCILVPMLTVLRACEDCLFFLHSCPFSARLWPARGVISLGMLVSTADLTGSYFLLPSVGSGYFLIPFHFNNSVCWAALGFYMSQLLRLSWVYY